MNNPDFPYWISFGSQTEEVAPGQVFSDFLMGAENQLAASAVQFILRDPSDVTNPDTSFLSEIPLFHLNPFLFYGPSGTGKTHLVQGIYRRFKKIWPQKSCLYITGHDFYLTFSEAVDEQNTNLFHQQIAAQNLLIIDGIDDLALHQTGQNELMILLEECRHQEQLVLLTMTTNPAEKPELMDSLVARLNSGLLIPLKYPQRETRKILIETMARRLSLKLSEPLLATMMTELPADVGGMSGALLQLSQQIQNQPQPAEPGEIPRLLQGRRSQREWTLDEITRETARCFSIKISEIRGKKRQKNIVAARNMAIWLARHLTSATLQELGRWFSHRDHSTILHGFHEMDAQLSQNPELQDIFRQIIKKLDAEQWFQNFTAGL